MLWEPSLTGGRGGGGGMGKNSDRRVIHFFLTQLLIAGREKRERQKGWGREGDVRSTAS